jgi:hypothetical protein
LLDRVISYAFSTHKDSRTVIPNLGYTYSQEYAKKKLNNGEEKAHMSTV